MNVLVTGANGHIGANVVRALLEDGHRVKAFIRAGADIRGLNGLDYDTVHGDVMNAAALEAAAKGCDAIIHLAAVYKTIADTPEEIVEPAVTGAKNVFAAAHAHGIKRIVYTSSVASIGFSYSPDQLRSADDWNDDAQNPYYVAKTQSEKVAQQLAKEYGIEVIVLCPAIVIGPYDYRITPSNQLVMEWLNGIGQTYQGGLNLVSVTDVAKAHVAALDHGESGERYILGGENIEVRQIGRLLKSLTGVTPIHLPTGRGLTLFFAGVVEALCRKLRLKPPFTRDLVYEVVGRFAWYDCERTWQTFPITPQPARESLTDAIAWLAAQGKLKPRVMRRLSLRAAPWLKRYTNDAN